MSTVLILHKPNYEIFIDRLVDCVDEMTKRYFPTRGVKFQDRQYTCVDEWEYPDPDPHYSQGHPAWIGKVDVYITTSESLRYTDDSMWIQFEISPLGAHFDQAGIQVAIEPNQLNAPPEMEVYFLELMKALAIRWPEVAEQLRDHGFVFDDQSTSDAEATAQPETELQDSTGDAEGGTGKKRGPTYKTTMRAKLFKQIKDEHPEWNRNKVALVAMDKEPWLGEISGETVRNAYRAMSWDWERADRVR